MLASTLHRSQYKQKKLCLPGEKLWSLWSHQVHSSRGPGHHAVRVPLGVRYCHEPQVPHVQGWGHETTVRSAVHQEKVTIQWLLIGLKTV